MHHSVFALKGSKVWKAVSGGDPWMGSYFSQRLNPTVFPSFIWSGSFGHFCPLQNPSLHTSWCSFFSLPLHNLKCLSFWVKKTLKNIPLSVLLSKGRPLMSFSGVPAAQRSKGGGAQSTPRGTATSGFTSANPSPPLHLYKAGTQHPPPKTMAVV